MEHARSGLQKIVMDSIRRAAPAEAPLLAWPVACGARIAEHTRAFSYAEGVLRVEVPDATWRHQLLSFVPQYLAMLRQFGVEKIEFVTTPSLRRASQTSPSRRRDDGKKDSA